MRPDPGEVIRVVRWLGVKTSEVSDREVAAGTGLSADRVEVVLSHLENAGKVERLEYDGEVRWLFTGRRVESQGDRIPDGLGCTERVPRWMLDDAPPWRTY